MAEIIEVLYVSNAGGGVANAKQIKQGTTLGQFLKSLDVNPNMPGQLVTVESRPEPVSYVLKDGELVAVTPTDVRGS